MSPDPSNPRPFERWLKDVHDADPGSVFPNLSLLRDGDGRTSYDALVEAVLDSIGVQTRPVVVDLGCGDGMLLALCGARIAGVKLIGVEQSANEGSLARETLRPFDAVVLEADVRSTGLQDASVDAVLSHMVLMLLDDADGALREAARILSGGGSFLSVVGPLFPPLGVLEPIGVLMSRALALEGKDRPQTDPRFRDEEPLRTIPWRSFGFSDAVIRRTVFSRRLTIDQLWGFVAQSYPAAMLSEVGFRELEAAVREEAALHAAGGMVDVQMALALLRAVRSTG